MHTPFLDKQLKGGKPKYNNHLPDFLRYSDLIKSIFLLSGKENIMKDKMWRGGTNGKTRA